jgi:2-methylcitrate dehydratase PrpD
MDAFETALANEPVLRIFARKAYGIRLEALPAKILHEMKLSVIDNMACMIAAADLPEVAHMVAAERETEPKEATVVAFGERMSREAAARVNGYMLDVLEVYDLLGGHASEAVIPTALAMAEATGATGAQFLEASVAGIELAGHIMHGYYGHVRSYEDVAIGPCGIPNAIACAAAAARLLDLSEQQLGEALAIAGAVAAWNGAETFYGDGGTVKPMMLAGWPPSPGMIAARYAAAGITGPERLLESKFGFLRSVATDFDYELLTDTDSWIIDMASRKRHANCGMMHAALDTLADLRHEYGDERMRTATIVHHMSVDVAPLLDKQPRPTTENEARFDVRYNSAVVLSGVDIVLPKYCTDFERYLADPQIQELHSHVEVVGDERYQDVMISEVEVHFADGEVLNRVTPPNRGAIWNPLTTDEVIDKFRALVADHLDADSIEAFLDAALHLEELDDVAPLLTTTRIPALSAASARA